MTREQLILLCLIPAGYLLGSVPFGLVVGLAKGIDPRKAGSGNIGATNVGRLLGVKFFALVFVLDMLKALAPMLVAAWVVRESAAEREGPMTYLLWMGAGLAAVLGHMFSIFLGFKGGKGVSTAAGMLLGLYPYYTAPAVVAILVFVIVLAGWRYMSVASMAGSVAFPFAYAAFAAWVFHSPLLGAQWPLTAAAVLVAALIVLKHRSNIQRLLAGTEKKLGKPA